MVQEKAAKSDRSCINIPEENATVGYEG